MEDTEIRYRQRYLDLIANEPVKEVFLKRSQILKEIRSFFHLRGYVEVETPMMQAIPGGAAAQPFKTFHNALGCEFYMRIALELYLKRLLVGGVDKVFEIGRNFRNEGLSRRHNPEFTMLEAYEAYGDYATMMETVESLIRHLALSVVGTLKIEHRNADGDIFKTIDLSHWRRARYKDLVREKAGDDWFQVSPEERRRRAVEDLKLSGDIAAGYEDFEVTAAVFEKLVEPTLIQPTFVTHLPKQLVPLAKISLKIRRRWKSSNAASMAKRSPRATPSRTTPSPSARPSSTRPAASSRSSTKISWWPSSTECLRPAASALASTACA